MPNKKSIIRLGGVPEHFNYPVHIALQQELFKQEGLLVEWIEFPDGTGAMNKALRSGTIDMAIILTEGIVRDIANGNPSKIVQNYVSSPLLWGIHVAEKSHFKQVADLKNARVAISRKGSGSHLMAFVHARENGWDTAGLTTLEMGTLDRAVEALTRGNADYFMWEHFTTKHLVDQNIFRRLADFPTPWSSFVIAARDEMIKKNHDAVLRFLKVLNPISTSLKEIGDIESKIADFYDQKPEDIQKWLSITSWSRDQLPEENLKTVQMRLLALEMISKHYENDFFLI